MSEYHIPFHVQEEIMKRLPVKLLIQFRSASKAWKSLIDSSEFIAAHSLHRHTHQQHLLVSYDDSDEETKYVSYINDDTFPQHRSLPTLPLPLSAKQILRPQVVGSSHGLLCLYGSDPNSTTKMFVLWNPSIRKYIVVALPTKSYGVGFGVCPVTNDPKIVSTTQPYWDVLRTSYEVMVYTLSSGKWRSLSTNLPTRRLRDSFRSVVTDGFIYWRSGSQTRNMIMSFDVTNESFEAIDLPDSLALSEQRLVRISKLRESLALIQNDGNFNFTTVWIMEEGIQRLFTKLFTITTQHNNIVGFTKNGVPVMKVTDDDGEELSKLVVYKPNSEHNNVLEIFPSIHFDNVNSYMETLLLLGRSDCNSC